MKLFLDDIRAPPDHTWVKVTTAFDCIVALQNQLVEYLSLDHDLGEEINGTGYDVLLWIEREVATNEHYKPPTYITLHSQNPVGRDNMLAAVKSIERMLTERE